MKTVCFVICIYLSLYNTLGGYRVNTVYKWVNLEYDYSSQSERQAAIDQSKFIPGSPRLVDIAVYYGEDNNRTVLVTCPRFLPGVPITLGTVTNNRYKGEQKIAPFPSWDWHTNWESCPEKRLVSVFRIQIDECNRLWVLDCGVADGVQKCAAQIVAFDLKTNALIYQYEIPASFLQSNSILSNVIVDTRGTCDGTMVYVTDARGFAIIVHDVDAGQSWRVTDKTFQASPDFGTVCVDGAHFDLMDGIQGAALSPYKVGRDRVLFYHSFSSNSEQWVWTSYLRNRTAIPNPDMFNVYCGRRDTQASPMEIDPRGIAYFGLAHNTSLNCWSTRYPYGKSSIKQLYKSSTIQYITGLRIFTDRSGREELWFANTRVAKIANSGTSKSTTNFWIHMAKLSDFVRYCADGSKIISNQGSGSPNACNSCVNRVS